MINGGRQPSRGGTSRMNREVHVRFCEGLGVKFPGPTRPTLPTCALQQVVGYLRYTGRDANIVEEAALDPRLPVRHVCFEGEFPRITGRGMDAKSAEN